MKKTIAVTLCAMLVAGTCTSVYAAEEPDPTKDESVIKAAEEEWEIAVVPKDSLIHGLFVWIPV